jgi:hypothetical protein
MLEADEDEAGAAQPARRPKHLRWPSAPASLLKRPRLLSRRTQPQSSVSADEGTLDIEGDAVSDRGPRCAARAS